MAKTEDGHILWQFKIDMRTIKDRKAELSFSGFSPGKEKTRLNMTKQIYAAKVSKTDSVGTQKDSGKLHRVHRSAPDFVFRSTKAAEPDQSDSMKDQASKENPLPDRTGAEGDQPAVQKPAKNKPIERQKLGVTKSHTSVKLVPLKDSNSTNKSYSSDYVSWSQYGDPTKPGPGNDKLARRHTQTNFSMFSNKSRINYNSRSIQDYQMRQTKDQGNMPHIQRSKSVLPPERIKFRSVAMIEMERRARIEADKAIREKKIFSILGPYPCLRMALRRRGWVEKFHNSPIPSELEVKRKPRISITDDAEDDVDNKNDKNVKKIKVQPWEEESGYYGLMSYLVRNSTPTFVFTVKSSDVDNRVTKSHQLVNHFGKARHFTTKSGLCVNLRSAVWYENTDPYTFYPRCYKTDEADEKTAFLDDFHWTACVSFVRSLVERYKNPTNIPRIGDEPGQPGMRHPRLPLITDKALDLALQQIEKFLKCRGHSDIDDLYETDVLTDCEWDQFLNWYKLFVHEGCDLHPITVEVVENCRELLERLKEHLPQFELDGVRNMWIIKPGAMSRGRGIQCSDNLETIVEAIDSTETGSLVVQKYIERPFLVYETKFDIRQWFLVTDWNPLTVWIYKDNYLRFCSKEFTLQDCSAAVHLSNNSVTKHMRNGPRSSKLPEDNTWTSDEFIEYLNENGQGQMWKEKVLPGIKNAIICCLLCTQEYIEGRKSAFELYGADFMITRDFQPWLLEINSSPSMSQSTHATSELVESVLEDTIKVVLDRRSGKGCDTGRFEMSYRQQGVQDPPPLDATLCIQGRRVRNRSPSKTPLVKREKSPQKGLTGKI